MARDSVTKRSVGVPEALGRGWTHMKMKVGGDLDNDVRRATLIREEIGPERFLMMDANQVWDVQEAITARDAWPSSTRGGWRSRRAPTTSSATRGSHARWRRLESPPASTATTA